jgi:hypothetical protein
MPFCYPFFSDDDSDTVELIEKLIKNHLKNDVTKQCVSESNKKTAL